jgi:hypothetical protein
MKKLFLFMLLIFTTVIANAQFGRLPEKPRIYITGVDAVGVNNAGETNKHLTLFEDIVLSALLKEIRCADIVTRDAIRTMMKFDRERVLLTNDESNFEAIAGAIGCDILICLSISKIGDDYYLSESTLGTRKAQAAGRMNAKTDINAMFNDMTKFANNLVRDLLAMEICAYKGDVTITSVKTFKDSEDRDGLPGQDCEFKATKDEEMKNEDTWSFKKVKRVQSEGKVNINWNSVKKETEHNTCAHCQIMENGYKLDQFEANHANMNSSSEITEKFTVNKMGKLNPEAAFEQYNSMVKIEFNTLANNYTITVKAVSEPAKWTRKVVNTNSGCPYDENFESETGATYPVAIDRTFGPFLGSPYEKTLKQTVTKTIIDPDSKGKGKTTETITFNLTR